MSLLQSNHNAQLLANQQKRVQELETINNSLEKQIISFKKDFEEETLKTKTIHQDVCDAISFLIVIVV